MFVSWRDEFRLLGKDAFPGQGRSRDEEVIRLKRELAKVKQEREKRSGGVLRQGVEMRYRCIDRHRNQYPVRMMCGALNVSSSGYYAWRSRPESERARTDRKLTEVIRQIHACCRGVYGAPRVREELKAEGLPPWASQGRSPDAPGRAERVSAAAF